MTHIVTTNFKYLAALNFIETMTSGTNSLYLFLGKQTPWDDETSPPNPLESVSHYKQLWDNMIAGKLITLNNMSLVVPSIKWTENNIYFAYSDKVDLAQASAANGLYIMTSTFDVYKCISNNYGALSTQQPIGTGTSSSNYIQTLSDGYQWKYMLNIEPTDKFFTNDWIPIPFIPAPNSFQDLMRQSAIPGSICKIDVLNSGYGYANNSNSYILTITGDGFGANAYANVNNGQIQNIIITELGQDYTYATVTVADLLDPFGGAIGTGAQLEAIMSPVGGHGSNAALELGVKSVMISVSTSDSENNTITVVNSFRQNGLLLNPTIFGTANIANTAYIQTAEYIVVGGGIGSFTINERVYQGPDINNSIFAGTVIDYNSSPNLLRLNNITGVPQTGGVLFGSDSGAQRYITIVGNPSVQPYSGYIIDYDNESSILRQSGQTELFQFIETFG